MAYSAVGLAPSAPGVHESFETRSKRGGDTGAAGSAPGAPGIGSSAGTRADTSLDAPLTFACAGARVRIADSGNGDGARPERESCATRTAREPMG